MVALYFSKIIYSFVLFYAGGGSLGSSLIIFLLFSVPWSILIEINNGQQIPLMWYIYSHIFFRILALENIAKILTNGPRLGRGRSGPPVLTSVDQRMNKCPMNIFYEHFYHMQVILPIIHPGFCR